MNDMNHEEWVSKTQMKKRMNELQDLGMELTRLSNETLKKAGLPEDLQQAIRDYKKITSNGATKRQTQYIDRLMRDSLARGRPVAIRPFNGFWLDIGRADDYESANENFSSLAQKLGLPL